jgi:hypothetical protein
LWLIFHYCVSISNQLWSEVSRKLYSTNLCGLFIVITSKKKDQYDHKSLFQLLVPYDSSSVLSYLNKYFHQIRLKIHKSSFIKKNHIFQFIVLFCYSFQMQLFKRNNKIKRMCKNVYWLKLRTFVKTKEQNKNKNRLVSGSHKFLVLNEIRYALKWLQQTVPTPF